MIPTVSVIIINWNHRHYLKNCLEGLRKQTYQGMEIIIVDNGSTDGSVEWLEAHYPDIQLLSFDRNLGFSQAFNIAMEKSRGSMLLSINPDVVARYNFVSELVHAANEDERIGMVAPKLLRAENPSILDSTGLFIDRRRRPHDRGQGCIDQGQYDEFKEVFGTCGAAALYRRAMLEDLEPDGEYFDEDFFAYYEDVDLSWRAKLRGWRTVYAPHAIATHVRGWGDTLRKHKGRLDGRGARMALCNRYLMIVKNDTLTNFMRDIPLILAAEIPRLVFIVIRKPSTLLGIVNFFQKLPSVWRKRRQFRKRNLINDSQIRGWFQSASFQEENRN